MPTYQYACEDCGPFTAVQKLAAFDQPAGCPVCSALSPRSFGVPDFLLGRAERVSRTADAATPGQASPYPRMRHGAGGCGCCPV